MGEIGAARATALFAVGWLGLSLVASLSAVLPMRVLPGIKPGPDVVLLVVLFVGLSGRGGPAGVAGFAVALGYLADLSGGAPKGLHMVACLLSALLARLASSRLMVRGALYTAVVSAFFVSLHDALLATLRVTLDAPGGPLGLGPLRRVPLVVLSTVLFAPPTFALLHRVDRYFSRDPRALSAARR